jgi:hypothetical protein
MKLGRRKFFGLAAGAAVGGKKVATDALTEMAQSAAPMRPAGGIMSAGNAIGSLSGGGDYITSLQGRAAKMAALRVVGIPPLVRDLMRSWAGQQHANLDDINSLVSVSVSAKKRMIRERMEDQMINDWLDQPGRELKRELFNKEFGVNL